MAVSTACGSLDAIVVETVDCGQKCIEFLKKGNLGRSTFICLDKIPKANIAKINTPDNAPRLFDLIKTDEKYLQAFYQALGNTLVASDLSQANKIAYGATRYRVVTLDGQLIDKSGTMSGGGSKPNKGGMNSERSNDEVSTQLLESITNDIQTKNFKIKELEGEVESMNSAVSEIRDKIHTCKRREKTIQLEIDSLEKEIIDAKENLKIAQ